MTEQQENQGQAPVDEGRTVRARSAAPLTFAVTTLLVMAAFVAGWRSRRGWGRLAGY